MVVVHGKNELYFYEHSKPNNFPEKWATVDSIESINSRSRTTKAIQVVNRSCRQWNIWLMNCLSGVW